MLRWHKVAAISRKEFRDILRDRRTVFMAVVFPLILYPLLIIGLIQAMVVEETKLRKEKPLVAISGAEYAPELAKEFAEAEGLKTTEFNGKAVQFSEMDADAGVVIPKGFSEILKSNGTAEVKVIYDSAKEKSVAARGKVQDIIENYGREVMAGRLKSASLDKAFIVPLDVHDTDIATPRQRGAYRLGRMLAFLLVVFCMMGALYPALDAVSGEKERGTLETLLSIPATRLEVLAGKYVAVFSMSMMSVASNFVSLSMTMLLVNKLLEGMSGGHLPIDFTVPFSAVMLIVPALVPLAAFFSAISLGIAAFARSTREGQYYLGPLYAACLPLTAAAVVPGLKLTYLTALVPVMSISLFLKDGLLGALSAGPTVVALFAQCAYAAVAMAWSASVFSREEVLFSLPPAQDETPREAAGYAKPSHALFVWVVSVILFFYIGAILAQRLGALNVTTAVIMYGGFVIGPALLLFFIDRLDVRKVLPFGVLGGRRLAGTLIMAPGAILVGIAFNVLQHVILPMPVDTVTVLKTHQEASFLALFSSVVFMPAVCEEILYRGVLLRSFAARMPVRLAIILSSLLFAAAHMDIYMILPLFALGVVLALSALSARTLMAPMLVHFANNCFTVFMTLAREKNPSLWWVRLFTSELGWWVAVAVGLAGIGLVAAALKVTGRGRDAAVSENAGS